MGIDPDDSVSPGVLKKLVYAGTKAVSFEQASEDLAEEAELQVTASRIRRATEKIGAERSVQRVKATERWRALPLPEQNRSPHEHVPTLACVQVDGGRAQIRARKTPSEESRGAAGFWRETKVACLLRMHSATHALDPCPTLPESFANIARMAQLSREIKGFSPASPDTTAERDEEETARPGRPQVLTRNVVALRAEASDFGAHVAARAWESGFAAAPRKAFVADGQASNWTIWRKYFSDYTPVLDFVHAACYVFNAAAAGRPLDEVAEVYRRWSQAVWSGRVADVLAELEARQAELGEPQETDADTHPRVIVADTLRYLRNQQTQMRYHEYRCQGLPITSAYIESTIKQINRRIKGSEKFWGDAGVVALLQLAADYLSDRAPLEQFWRERPATRTGLRCYR